MLQADSDHSITSQPSHRYLGSFAQLVSCNIANALSRWTDCINVNGTAECCQYYNHQLPQKYPTVQLFAFMFLRQCFKTIGEPIHLLTSFLVQEQVITMCLLPHARVGSLRFYTFLCVCVCLCVCVWVCVCLCVSVCLCFWVITFEPIHLLTSFLI